MDYDISFEVLKKIVSKDTLTLSEQTVWEIGYKNLIPNGAKWLNDKGTWEGWAPPVIGKDSVTYEKCRFVKIKADEGVVYLTYIIYEGDYSGYPTKERCVFDFIVDENGYEKDLKEQIKADTNNLLFSIAREKYIKEELRKKMLAIDEIIKNELLVL